jgi:hypothetical protein
LPSRMKQRSIPVYLVQWQLAFPGKSR